MGWAFGKNAEGRDVGYGVEAICDEPGCEEKIDRGISYVCGGMHDGGDHGCGKYFCGKHLFYVVRPEKVKDADKTGQFCNDCADRARCAECWEDEEELVTVNGRLLCPSCVLEEAHA